MRLSVAAVLVAAVAVATAQQKGPEDAPSSVLIRITDRREVGSHHLNPAAIRVSGRRDAFSSVAIEVVVDRDGNVIAVEASERYRSRNADRAAVAEKYKDAALAEARNWHYKPFERNGKPVPATFVDFVRLLPPERTPQRHVDFPEVSDWNSLRMSLTRTPCFGSCPSYTDEIRGDGSLTFTGKGWVTMRGEYHSRISQDAVRQILEAFRAADYFSLDNEYRYPVTDNPTYVTSISFNGAEKSVTDYVGEEVGMPSSVTALELAIDRLSGTDKWVTGNGETVSNPETRPLIKTASSGDEQP